MVAAHEMGHAMDLRHAFATNGLSNACIISFFDHAAPRSVLMIFQRHGICLSPSSQHRKQQMLAARNEHFIARFPGGVATVPVEVPDGGCGKVIK